MSVLEKAAAVRVRHTVTLKKTIDIISTLTSAACSSTLTVYSNDLETNWSAYVIAFNEYEKAAVGQDDNLLSTTAEYTSLHALLLKARISLGKLMSSNEGANTSMFEQTIAQTNNLPNMVKLPPCKLTEFSGNPKDWPEFKATCRSLLTEQIPEIQRLQYLKEALKGEPRELLSFVLPGDGCFEKAMYLLKNRFENARLIVNDQLQGLYSIPRNEPKRESINTLRSIVNTINGLKAALSEFKIDTSTWDAILIYNTTQCLHIDSIKAWEEKLGGSRSIPSLDAYFDFIETRIGILQAATFMAQPEHNIIEKGKKPLRHAFDDRREKVNIHYTLKSEYKCVICKQNHLASRCDELRRMSVQERRTAVQKNGLCFNCLQPHMVVNCPFSATCKKCRESHHTLLHVEDNAKVMVTQETNGNDDDEDFDSSADALSLACSAHFYHVNTKNVTILATALVPVRWNGRSILLNALVDQGATTNLISERACQMLGLKIKRSNASMTGIDNTPLGRVLGRTAHTIGSIHENEYDFGMSALVVKKVAEFSPLNCNEREKWKHLRRLPLADPNFTRTRRVDLLLGASVYAEIIESNVVKGSPDEPIAQQTKLGWIVFGPAEVDSEYSALCHTLQQRPNNDSNDDDLSQLIKSFWELEEVENTKYLTPDEQAAEDAFVSSLKRSTDGKFVVDLPFKSDPKSDCLGKSYEQAEKRLRSSQRRFSKNPEAKRLYDQNLNEYLELGHMRELDEGDIPRNYLPHHPVVKESSSTTKVRTVFDASAKTSNGLSLNDILYVGPTIQPELFDLLIQWRRFKYAFCADIEKMYRQVWVNPEHALFQCILWQHPESDTVKTFKLLTVTFGTGSAPFQAIRAVDEIGIRVQDDDPEVGNAIRKQFYVDDYLGNTDKLENAIYLRKRITDELANYGFKLRKWKANDQRILVGLTGGDREELVNFDTTFKTLGIAWHPNTDKFQFNATKPKQIAKWTKRSVLSEIAKLYDPLGWLAPCVAKAKMLMQDIWRLPNSYDWDTPLPDQIAIRWQTIYIQLCLPIPIHVPRWIGLSSDAICIEIHGFCDAAHQAYAAAVYVKVQYKNNRRICNLLAAKTKLAPIKTVSIPRLELCGAVLLSKLIIRCRKALSLADHQVFAWSDSMVTLSWIAACPSRWSTFVANRVSQIQRALPTEIWQHVPTKQNPADIASRGALVQELSKANLWWHGPEFLIDSSLTPNTMVKLNEEEIPERKKTVEVFHVTEPIENYVLNRFSSYTRLLRFTALAMRWKNHARNRSDTIRAREICAAQRKWVTIVQGEMFSKDMTSIRHENQPSTSSLKQLCPFIDEHGILRMNGRIGNADMREQKTAIILPAQHPLTTLIIRHAHEEVLHGGVQITLRKLRDQFWILHGRNQVKKLIHKCVRCFRYRKQLMNQKMADLPSFRTEQSRPFAYVGIDYAGPFEIKTSGLRNAPKTKGYIALFICLATKAIHLELVPDLSTAEFIMAFENFIARRGIPIIVYTDNGTNFIGGANEIDRMFSQMLKQNNGLTKMFAMKNIEFKTIPARASHMAGIWERAVGSVKYHLRRVLKDTKLNGRQFDYVLKQIEACLNSRPLWSVSPESDDIEVLTPSHFFNFQAINTLPRPDLGHLPENKLDQYQYLYRLYCNFWKDWSREYLHQFQIRPKWQKDHDNAIIGQIVLVSEDNLPPSRWALGKIVNTYPGKDGLVRAVDVLCGKSTLRRPIHKLALLPIAENEELELLKKAQGGENVVSKQ